MFGQQKLFGSKIEPACSYCKLGTPTTDGSMILCEKQGVVALHFSCRRFQYDPLKRVPKRPGPRPRFDREDFTL